MSLLHGRLQRSKSEFRGSDGAALSLPLPTRSSNGSVTTGASLGKKIERVIGAALRPSYDKREPLRRSADSRRAVVEIRIIPIGPGCARADLPWRLACRCGAA